MHRMIVTFGAVLLTAGCAFAPAPVDPVLPVANAWPGGDVASQDALGSVSWRRFFADPSLQATIERALENNRDLRVAMLRVEEARQAYRIQRADLLPAVGASAATARGQTPQDLSLTGRTVTASQYSAELSLSWELDFWGRVRSLEAGALERWLAGDEARRAATLTLVGAVANAWLTERELDERIALADRTLASRRESSRIAQRRYEIGYSSRFDMIQAETLLAQAESQRINLGRAREQARNALTLLVGASVDDTAASLSSVEAALGRDLPPGLPSDLLWSRPDIRAAEHRMRAADADIGAARAALFPRIALTGDFGSASTDLDHLFGGTDDRLWSLAGSAAAPVFDGGRTRASLAAARTRREIATAQYEGAVQSAFRDVADALAARRWLTDQVVVQRRTLAALTERSRLSGLRYSSGAATYLEVLDAERDLFSAEQALVETRRALLSSNVNLYAALGGGADLPEPNMSERAPS